MSASEPVYAAMIRELREHIERGELLPGETLPSENELARRYGVSRGSTRMALSELAAERLIEKRPGSGSVVLDPSLTEGETRQPMIIGVDAGEALFSDGRGYYQDLFRGVAAACAEFNCKLQMANGLVPETVERSGLDGLIVTRPDSHPSDWVAGVARRLPVAVLNRFVTERGVVSLGIDDVMEAFKAVEYLIKNGHEEIAFVGNAFSYGLLRRKGYLVALRSYGLDSDPKRIVCENPCEALFDEVKRLIIDVKPTAIFSAVGAYHLNFVDPILRELGLDVPEDVSLVCFDDIEETVFHYGPPLTCVRQPLFEMGKAAVKELVDRSEPPRRRTFQTELVIRQSCRNLTRPEIVMENDVREALS